MLKLAEPLTLTILRSFKFVIKIAYLSEDEGHHPHVHLNFKNVEVIIFTHKINGLHENDFILAAKIDQIANPDSLSFSNKFPGDNAFTIRKKLAGKYLIIGSFILNRTIRADNIIKRSKNDIIKAK